MTYWCAPLAANLWETQSLRIPSPEPCHPDAERKRGLAVSHRRPKATFPRREARIPEVQALPSLSRCSAGAPGPLAPRPRDGTSCRGPAGPPPSAEPSPARPPRPRAARAPAPGAAGVWDAAVAGANLARGRATPARTYPAAAAAPQPAGAPASEPGKAKEKQRPPRPVWSPRPVRPPPAGGSARAPRGHSALAR